MNNKKAGAGLVAIAIVAILVIFFIYLIDVSHRECNHNSDCGTYSYCGSDFACHEYPTIQRNEYYFFWPAIIIGLAIVAAMIIYKLFPEIEWTWKRAEPEVKIEKVEIKTEEPIVEEKKEEEVYYKSTTKSN